MKFGIIIIAVSIIVFTGISIMTNNWMFLLLSIPPNLIGLFTALTPNKKDSE
jgi:cadmium resistance protein CadD (predicted permease)